MKNQLPAVNWIESSAEFSSLCQSWQDTEYLAIDTEFERRTTYYPILALLQIFDGKKIYIVDPKKVECNDDFRRLCSNPDIVKIMHSAKEDLQVLFYSWQCRLQNLFDTQVAYSFVTGEGSLGYAGLVEKITGEQLAKDATQSDWLARPLSDNQIDYAAKDVFYLPPIYLSLLEQLEDKSYYQFFQFECNEFCQQAEKLFDSELDYRHAKEIWRLKSEQLNRFKRLYNWREETAIKENRTRNHLFKDPQLVQIAMLKNVNRRSLQNITGIHPKSIRLYGEKVANILEQDEYDGHQVLEPVANPRDVPQLKALTNHFIESNDKMAKQIKLNPSILMSKRQIRKVAYSYITGEASPEIWNGWRGNLLKTSFDQIFSQLNT